MEVRRELDGTVRGYSPTLDIYWVWELQREGDREAYLRLYDPATGRRLLSYTELLEDLEAARAMTAAYNRIAAAAAESRRLREQIRQLQGC